MGGPGLLLLEERLGLGPGRRPGSRSPRPGRETGFVCTYSQRAASESWSVGAARLGSRCHTPGPMGGVALVVTLVLGAVGLAAVLRLFTPSTASSAAEPLTPPSGSPVQPAGRRRPARALTGSYPGPDRRGTCRASSDPGRAAPGPGPCSGVSMSGGDGCGASRLREAGDFGEDLTPAPSRRNEPLPGVFQTCIISTRIESMEQSAA
jgi:hypothetical protein